MDLARLARTVVLCNSVSTDAKPIIRTIVGTGLVVAGLVSAQISGVNTRIDDLRTEPSAESAVLPDAVRGMDARLRDVETAFGKVNQRHPPSNAPSSPARPASETATAPISPTRLDRMAPG